MTDQPDDLEFPLPHPDEDDRPGIDDADDFLDDDDNDDDDEDDLDEDDELDDLDDEYPEDATADDVDIAVALYREDGQATAVALDLELVNDLEALIEYLRRLPGDAGSLGMISLADEVFVLARVRGRTVQLYLSDVVAADEWPIARDIVEYLGEDLPADDDPPAPVGDGSMLADAGLHEIDLEAIATDYSEDATVLLERIAAKIQFGPQFRAALADEE